MPKGNTISKKQVVAPAIAAVLVVMASTTLMSGAAYAQTITRDGGLHFVGTPTATTEGNELTVTFEVAGAGRTATATLTGDAIVTQGCVNRGGGEPRGLQETTDPFEVTDTFQTRQGRSGVQELEATATGDPDFECPSRNMRETIVGVEFTNVVLTVTSQTGTTTADFGDVS